MSEDVPSVCDIMKGNTSTIIKKLETQLPVNLQIYSDIYQEYLHMIDDLFGTCYIAEKEIFDKIVPDPNSRKLMDSYGKFFTKISVLQIQNYSNFLKWYSDIRIKSMKNYDEYAHKIIESYMRMISNFSAKSEK